MIKDKIEILFNTAPYRSVVKDSKGNIYMNLCNNERELLSIIRKIAPDGTYKDYDLSPFNIKFDNFKLSKDEKYLFLIALNMLNIHISLTALLSDFLTKVLNIALNQEIIFY